MKMLKKISIIKIDEKFDEEKVLQTIIDEKVNEKLKKKR
jgi:hypothetical protein